MWRFLIASLTYFIWSAQSYGLTWEINYSENSSPLYKGRLDLNQPESVEQVSQKIFSSNNIAYNLSENFFSFIDGKPWPWCFYVMERVAFIPGIPQYLWRKQFRIKEDIWKPDQNISGDQHLVWCHCHHWPLNPGDMAAN